MTHIDWSSLQQNRGIKGKHTCAVAIFSLVSLRNTFWAQCHPSIKGMHRVGWLCHVTVAPYMLSNPFFCSLAALAMSNDLDFVVLCGAESRSLVTLVALDPFEDDLLLLLGKSNVIALCRLRRPCSSSSFRTAPSDSL
jgi:hypothetical protein